MFTLYTKNNCIQCKMTKDVLKKEGWTEGEDFESINLDENPDKLQELVNLGYRSAPVVQVGNESWAGFNPSKIRKIKDFVKKA